MGVINCGVEGHLVSAKFGTDQVVARDMATPQESRVSMELTIDDFVHFGGSAADAAVDYMPLERTENVCLTIDDLVSKSEPTIELAHGEQVNHDRHMVLACGDFPPESRAEALMQSAGGREVAIDNDVTLHPMTHFALETEARGATVDGLMPVRNSATLTIDDLTHDSASGQSRVQEAPIQNVVGVCGEASSTRVDAGLTIDDLVYAVPETENDTLVQDVDADRVQERTCARSVGCSAFSGTIWTWLVSRNRQPLHFSISRRVCRGLEKRRASFSLSAPSSRPRFAFAVAIVPFPLNFCYLWDRSRAVKSACCAVAEAQLFSIRSSARESLGKWGSLLALCVTLQILIEVQRPNAKPDAWDVPLSRERRTQNVRSRGK